MEKRLIDAKLKHLKKDIKKITTFVDNFFVFTDCNCPNCCKKRNKSKLQLLIASLYFNKMVSYACKPEDVFINNYILRELDNIISQYKRAINSHTIQTLQVQPSKNLTVCKYCGTLMKKNVTFKPSNVCNHCLSMYYVKCFCCGIYMEPKEDLDISPYNYCKKCIKNTVPCTQCNKRVLKSKVVKLKKYQKRQNGAIKSNGSFCSNCAQSFMPCEDCGIYVHASSSHRYAGNHYCNTCILNHKKLFEYNYIPKYNFRTIDANTDQKMNTLYFGCEIEIEQDIDEVHTDKERFICSVAKEFGNSFLFGKMDGSLHDGFEFVTHPFTWEWFLLNKYKFNHMFSMAKFAGFMCSSNCGIHIHMTKSIFTTCQLYKFIDFINNPNNLGFIDTVARRHVKFSTYCKPFTVDCTDEETKKRLVKIAKKKNNADFNRYTAVNLTLKDTVEVRIFNGTLSSTQFFSYLEFVHALFHFTKNTSLKDCTTKKYIQFVANNKTSYSNIYQLIK